MKDGTPGRGTVKTSAILIASGNRFSVYRKLEEVPPPLRSKLEKSTAGANAGTVLIADRRGAEELLRANIRSSIERRPNRVRRLSQSVREDLQVMGRCLQDYWRILVFVILLVAAVCWGLATVRG